MRTLARTMLAVGPILLASACRPVVDLTAALHVDAVSTGWLDAGTVDGLNKLTPTLSCTLTNVSGEPLPALQLNAVFRRAGDASEWSARFLSATGSPTLQPGRSTATLTLTSDLGYTGTERAEDLLRNTRFVDADVDLFARYASTQWVRLARFRVARQLVGSR